MNSKKCKSNTYKYGFSTNIKSNIIYNISEKTILNISNTNKEPKWLLDWRMEAYKYWLHFYKTFGDPRWSNLKYKYINFNDIIYYSNPLENISSKNNKINKTFSRLGVNLSKNNSFAIDAILDSVSVANSLNNELKELGIIFCSFNEAILKYPFLVEKYLGTVVSYKDNFFSALNSSVFSDGSFCYIPKNIICPIELSTYFRINSSKLGQFERTLIIADEDSFVSYIEGCSASLKKENQLHAAVVELIAFKNSTIKYSTIQNWYPGNINGFGGIYNFVTKRGICKGENSSISWIQVESGSSSTWKYPSIILNGNNSKGDFYSVSVTNNFQQADTGTKIIHIGENCISNIISKSVISSNSLNSYRGLVKILSKSLNSSNNTKCDSIMLGNSCISSTIPISLMLNTSSLIEQEAFTGKINLDQIFYCMQKGLNINLIIFLIINGFCHIVFKKMPMEFSIEAQKLLKENLKEFIN